MEFKTATMADFDVAFDYIEKLWDYNTYDKDVIRKVYADVLADENSFAFFLIKRNFQLFQNLTDMSLSFFPNFFGSYIFFFVIRVPFRKSIGYIFSDS